MRVGVDVDTTVAVGWGVEVAALIAVGLAAATLTGMLLASGEAAGDAMAATIPGKPVGIGGGTTVSEPPPLAAAATAVGTAATTVLDAPVTGGRDTGARSIRGGVASRQRQQANGRQHRDDGRRDRNERPARAHWQACAPHGRDDLGCVGGCQLSGHGRRERDRSAGERRQTAVTLSGAPRSLASVINRSAAAPGEASWQDRRSRSRARPTSSRPSRARRHRPPQGRGGQHRPGPSLRGRGLA